MQTGKCCVTTKCFMLIKKTSAFFLVAKLVYALGMDESQRPIWLLSALVSAEMNGAMPEFTELKYQMSNRHKDLSLSRIQKDHQNARIYLNSLQSATI